MPWKTFLNLVLTDWGWMGELDMQLVNGVQHGMNCAGLESKTGIWGV